ncbi:MAG TPA: YggS family pyridoxal phosphate-dependent enzyme [Xanthomonadaceae bacterium]|nr:YggS family pyridoxal phosphate-dependent enzyme [Xanthomonadaceae bacterium]
MQAVLDRIESARRRAGTGAPVRLLAVGKAQPVRALAALADAGQRAFGENYLGEALAKQQALAGRDLRWHFIGHLQSNKCAGVAAHFHWLQSLDRPRLVEPLARARPPGLAPLQVLVQVNIDREASKSGCAPAAVGPLAESIARTPALRLRGLMAIPAPHADPTLRRVAFARMRTLFEALRGEHPGIDTLSMGMTEDFELAIEEGATMVRIGTALFGPRP